VIVRIDVLAVVPGTGRVLVAEVIGGYHGQAQLGRWWLPSGLVGEGEQPGDAASRIVREQLGLVLDDAVLVGGRQGRVGDAWHLALVVAGAVSGEPAPRHPVSGFAARTMGELPDQLGSWQRDEVALLASRYERLRG
jgi:ADP-ribose pyrophosphatase YjhB (NUDIX family)